MTNPNDTINVIIHPTSGEVECSGLTKREYFAAMAMQGFVTKINGLTFNIDGAAVRSVQAADELIKALNETLA